MIYIITPYLSDLKLTCDIHGIACEIRNGKILNSRILWIYDWIQLSGRKINQSDRVYFGKQCYKFNTTMYNRIYEEIQLRKMY